MINDDIEERLREALRLHAAEAPPGASMLGAVTAESVRRGRRARLASLSAGAAVFVVVGAVLSIALRGPAGEEPPPAVGAPPPVTAVAPASAVVLVRSTVLPAVTFPFSPPSGPGYGPPLVTITAGRPTLAQRLPGADGGTATLTLYDAAPPRKAVAAPATVHGQVATLYDWSTAGAGPQRMLVWQPAPSTWLTLTEDGPVPAAGDLVAYAEAVTVGAVKAQAPFTFRSVPDGWTVDNITSGVITFCPPGVRPDGSFVDKLAVMLDDSPSVEPRPGVESVAVKVGARTGTLTTSAEAQVLHVPLDEGRSLALQLGPKAALPTDVLVAFAAGIEVTPSAQVSRG
ncbi:hypothetical protein [Dactylosporangium sp. CA-092794]|uniref:hypothetical protein n=1 Tax=Dactylosporangium sp. CA-092794 TaxID=3239929 RepID=UPI003D93C7BC